jgi:hypothetical protein
MNRKPKNELTRKRENRGYTPNEKSLEIQNEIFQQYVRIKKELENVNPTNNLYKNLVLLLLKIEAQMRTFTVEKTDEMKFNEIVEEAE